MKKKSAGKKAAERFFEIRFESIGGLGAHAAGQILAQAAVMRMGYNGAHFSSYGSEKKGSVVRSFVRIGPGDLALRTSAPIETPDVIVVFHSALLKNPASLAGLRADGTLIVNAAPELAVPELARAPKTARIIRVNATRIALDEKSRPNAVLLGTLGNLIPMIDQDKLLEELNEEFAGRHPEAVASNERAFKRGAAEYEELKGVGQAKGNLPIVRSSAVWGYKTAPMGGVLPTPGNSAHNDLSMSRTGFIPVLDGDKCIHCGSCDLVCPDLCLVWETEGEGPVPKRTRLMGIDFRYCKGCLRCVESCPTGALSKQIEEPGMADKLRVALFPGLVK